MKRDRTVRVGKIRKYNKYLADLANRADSPTLKILILMGKINNKNGHVVQKGHVEHVEHVEH